MFAQLLDYVAKHPEARERDLSLEDIALCLTWYDAQCDDPAQRQAYAPVAAELRSNWVLTAKQRDLQAMARRQQPVLRELIDLLAAGQAERLALGEVEYLLTVYNFFKTVDFALESRRPLELLKPHVADLEALRKTLPPDPDLASLRARITIVTARQLLEAERTAVDQLGDVPYDFRGAVFNHTGNLKVIGSIPEQTAVIVKSGSAYVSGYVLGCLAADGDCEITENVAGAVVSVEGTIRARKLIDRALAVAQRGSVICGQANIPSLVFAGDRIEVAGGTVMGRMVAPVIHVRGDVIGGEYHVARLLEAPLFRHSDSRPLVIVLRKEISGKDYGREMPVEIIRLMSHYRYLKHRRKLLREYLATTRDEVERHARAGLLYLLGGDRILEQLQAVHEATQRLAVLDRILTGLNEISDGAEERLRTAFQTRSAPKHSAFSLLASVSQDLVQMETEGRLDSDLAAEREQLLDIDRRLANQEIDKAYVASTLRRVRQRIDTWMQERQELINTIKTGEAEMQKDLVKAETLKKLLEHDSKVQVFEQMLAAASQRHPSDPLAKRAATTFVRVMARILSQRQRRLERLTIEAGEVEAEYTQALAQLKSDSNARAVLAQEDVETRPQVKGRFEPGVKVCADPIYLEETEPSEYVRFTAHSDTPRTFTKSGDRVVEAFT